jgi:hypothetical protein
MSERMIWPNWCGANIVAPGLKSETGCHYHYRETVIMSRTVGAFRIAPLAGSVTDQIHGPTDELEQAII